MTSDPMREAKNWLNHVKTNSADFNEIDEYTKRDLCQGLFMVIYELTRAYLMHISTKLPETHAEIFHIFESRKDIDPFLSKLSDLYNEAFHFLHVDCHYKGQIDETVFFRWLRKIEDFFVLIEKKIGLS